MKRSRTLIISYVGFALLTLLAPEVSAQPVADLEIIVTNPLPEVTPPDSAGTFAFRITNLGPDRAGGPDDQQQTIIAEATPRLYPAQGGLDIAFYDIPTSSCVLDEEIINSPGNPRQLKYSISFGPLDIGEYIDCELFYDVNRYIDGDRTIRWLVESPLDDDPNPANDEIVLQFIYVPRPVADLQIVLTKPLPSVTPPGSSGTFAYRVTNLGPDTAGEFGDRQVTILSGSSPIVFNIGIGPEIVLYDVPGSDCSLYLGYIEPAPGNPFQVDYSHRLAPLEIGESVECEIYYFVSRYIAGDLDVRWDLYSYLTDDPDPTNDAVVLPFRLAPAPIPTLDPWALVLLASALFVASVVVRRRRRGPTVSRSEASPGLRSSAR